MVLSNLYNEPYIAVDTHVQRVSKRLGITKSDDVYKTEKRFGQIHDHGTTFNIMDLLIFKLQYEELTSNHSIRISHGFKL